MKNKAQGVLIIELRSKMYSNMEEGHTGDKKTKGNKKCLIENAMKHGE